MEYPYLQFAVHLDLRNEAFQPDPAPEVIRALALLAKLIQDAPSHYFPASGLSCAVHFQIPDSDGNVIGHARVS